MDKNLEKEIEEAGKRYAESISLVEEGSLSTDLEYDDEFHAEIFEIGAKSPEAKEYWQQGMYTEREVLDLLRRGHFVECNYELWFKQNKK